MTCLLDGVRWGGWGTLPQEKQRTGIIIAEDVGGLSLKMKFRSPVAGLFADGSLANHRSRRSRSDLTFRVQPLQEYFLQVAKDTEKIMTLLVD